MVGGSARIPKIRSLVSTYFDGKTLHTSLNPEEAVVLGAGLQAAVLCGIGPREILEKIILVDAIPYDLGYESQGGVMNPILRQNTLLPSKKSQVLSNFNGIGNSIRVSLSQS